MNVKTDAPGAVGLQQQMLAEMQRMHAQSIGSGIAAPVQPAVGALAGSPRFSQVLDEAIAHVDSQQHLASERQRAIDMGTSDDLVGAMVESQKASVAFSAMVQVRNKLQQSFDEVMNLSL